MAAGVALAAVLGWLPAVCARGQSGGNPGNPDAASDGSLGASSASQGRVLLVLPFDNRTGQPSLEWIREAAAEILSTRFASAGFQPTSRADRMYALDHLGLPQGFQPSRASSLKLAQTLDADSIVVGSYTTDGSGIVAEASLVDVPQLRMMPEVSVRGEMHDLIAVFGTLAWKLTRQLDPSFSVAEETFAAAGNGIPLTAYEQYIRGITEPDQAERVRHLQTCGKAEPGFGPAWMALGREDYNGQQYPDAATAFAKVDRNDTDGLEAAFYRGLSLLFLGDYAHAEQAFAEVARVLPLAEVVNNEGVAVSRQGHDGTPLFIQAAAADPNAADYHFNLAVSLKRHGNSAGAANELAQCLKLRPNDSEAQSLAAEWKLPGVAASTTAGGTPTPAQTPIRWSGLCAPLTPPLSGRRRRCWTRWMPGGWPRYRRANGRGPSVRRRRAISIAACCSRPSGCIRPPWLPTAMAPRRMPGWPKCANAAATPMPRAKRRMRPWNWGPSADAYLVLARLDLAAGSVGEADTEAGDALKLDPASPVAQELLRQILARMGQR